MLGATLLVLLGSVAASTAFGQLSDADASANGLRKPSATPRCVITSVKADKMTGNVAAAGNCKVRGKYRVPIKWTYVYTAYDHAGYACGAAITGKSKRFRLKPPGSHKMTVRFALSAKPRKGLKRAKPVSKTRTFELGGQMAMCGKLGSVPLPPPQELCPWSEPQHAPYCGSPTSGSECAWSSTPSMSDGVISAGRLVCEAANCWLEPLPRLRSFDWLGYSVDTAWLRCGEDLVFDLHTWSVGMINPQGQTCGPVRPPYINFVAFRVPPTWGGVLRVVWRVQGSRGQEVATASFNLPGRDDGCPMLVASGRPLSD